MKYYSLIGEPLRVENKHITDIVFDKLLDEVTLSSYHSSGTVLYGFTLPQNENATRAILFEKYRIWQNPLGWGKSGRPVSLYKSPFGNMLENPEPIFVGDLTAHGFVHSAVMEYDRYLKIWKGTVTLEKTPPLTRSYINDNKFSSDLIETDRGLNDIPEAVKTAIKSALAGANIPTFGTVVFPALAGDLFALSLDTVKSQNDTKISQEELDKV